MKTIPYCHTNDAIWDSSYYRNDSIMNPGYSFLVIAFHLTDREFPDQQEGNAVGLG